MAVLSAKEAAALAIIGINEIQLKGQGVTARIIKGLGRAALRLAPFAARAAPTAARAVLPPITGPAALAYGEYLTAKAAMDQAERDYETYQEPRIPIPLWNPLLGDMPTVAVPKAIRKASKFNKAISAGMKAVKSSKSFGKKGTISNSKKAFATVTKTVSAIKKGRKRPTKGVRGTIARAARRYI